MASAALAAIPTSLQQRWQQQPSARRPLQAAVRCPPTRASRCCQRRLQAAASGDAAKPEPAAQAAQAAGVPAAAAAAASSSPPAGTTLADILRFCLPVVLVPLADPIMSLIDTLCLGRMASVLELAALGPSSLLLTFCNYVLFGLSVGTVSLVAERLKAQDREGAAHALSASLFLGALGGAAMGAILLLWCPQLLRLTGADAAVAVYATRYLRIRALALPAVLLVQVSQAGLLAQRDSISPFRVVLATSAVSLAGDLLFIGRLGLGVAGAAATTVVAQYLGAALLIGTLRRSPVRPHLMVPGAAQLRALASTFGVLTVFYASKNFCYLLIQSTAAALPALVLAAHQPIWSLWCLVSFTNTPLESAALAFLPAAADARERRSTARLLMLLGACSGILGCTVAVGVPQLAPHLLVADAALWAPMRSVGLQATLAMLCCGIDVASNGVLMAQKDTAYVARAMAFCLLGLAGFLAWARQATPGLPAVWWGLAVFFFFRASQTVPRAVKLLGLAGGGAAAATEQQAQQPPLAEPA